MDRLVNGSPVVMSPSEQAELAATFPDEKAERRGRTSITDLQFAAAAILPPFSFMTPQEAADWVGAGAIPAVAQAVIDALPTQAERDIATIRIRGARTIDRSEHFVSALAASKGLTEDQVDEFFDFARGLF